MKNENGIPTLLTKKIKLRPFKLDDASEVQRLAGHPQVAATTATIPHPYPDGAAEEWISKHEDWFSKGYSVDWAIELVPEEKLVGCMSLVISKSNLKAEIGYWIGVDFWNKGLCTEAAYEAVKYAFKELNLNKITSRHMSANPSSGRVMQKIGLKQEGFLKQELLKNGIFEDVVVYGLLKEDFNKGQ